MVWLALPTLLFLALGALGLKRWKSNAARSDSFTSVERSVFNEPLFTKGGLEPILAEGVQETQEWTL